MPSAADGSTTRPACSRSIRRPAMIDASRTRTASSATRRRSSRTAWMGRRPATPSAMVSVESVVTTRRCRQEYVIAGAPSGWTQMTSTSGARVFRTWPTPVASAPPPRAIRTASNDGAVSVSSRPIVAAPSQVSMSRLSSTSRIPSCRATAAARSRAMSKSPSTRSSRAPRARMRSSFAAGAKRDATTVTSIPRPRPDQARAWPRFPALAHTTARAPLPASRLAITSVPRPLKLRTGFAVSSLMLTAHPRPGSSASQRYSGVPRKTGSITRRAARIRAMSRRVSGMTQQRTADDAVRLEALSGPL